jgi:sugar phosphate isomerase/epimerase
MALVAQVANAFGARVVPMAAGGTWGVPVYDGGSSAMAAGVSQADLRRLLGTLEQTARRRPAQVQNVFNEKIDPLHVARQIAWQVQG